MRAFTSFYRFCMQIRAGLPAAIRAGRKVQTPNSSEPLQSRFRVCMANCRGAISASSAEAAPTSQPSFWPLFT